jgi:hypothetical protein
MRPPPSAAIAIGDGVVARDWGARLDLAVAGEGTANERGGGREAKANGKRRLTGEGL